MDAAADAALFTADFGLMADIGGTSVRGILDSAFAEVLGVESLHPIFTAPSAALPAIAHGTAVTIGATSYRVVGIQPDGTGITQLVLERQ